MEGRKDSNTQGNAPLRKFRYNSEQFLVLMMCAPIALPRDVRRLLWWYCRDVSSGWMLQEGSLRKLRCGQYYVNLMTYHFTVPLSFPLDATSLHCIGKPWCKRKGRKYLFQFKADEGVMKWLREVTAYVNRNIYHHDGRFFTRGKPVRPHLVPEPVDLITLYFDGAQSVRWISNSEGCVVNFGRSKEVVLCHGQFIPFESLYLQAYGTTSPLGARSLILGLVG